MPLVFLSPCWKLTRDKYLLVTFMAKADKWIRRKLNSVMKSYKSLWGDFISPENYRSAVLSATKHKSGRKSKYRYARHFKTHIDELQDEMLYYAANYKNHEHKPLEIYDGVQRKKRIIIVPKMDEQVVHHMAINILKPIFMKGMYEHSYGSIPDRGAHKAKKQIEKWIARKDKHMKYCLKMDIRKFFDSIPHDLIKAKLSDIIKDEKFLSVILEIINATEKGLPLGFYTSQWFANWYLQGLDHYIKEDLKACYYVRYMDDMVIFGSSKKQLHLVRKAVAAYLRNELGLTLKDNWQVFLFDYVKKNGERIGRDLDFMGFRFYRDHTTLRKALMIKASKKARTICKKPEKTLYDCRQMISYLGWLDCTDTYSMYKKQIKPFISFRKLRQQISKKEREAKCGENQKTAMK